MTDLGRYFGLRKVGVVYLWIGVIVFFSILRPETFPTWDTAKVILNQNAVAGLLALSLVAPLATRVFDLSIGFTMALSSVLIGHMLTETGVPVVPSILITLCAGLAIGLANGFLVVRMKIDSFIGTLATGALLQSAIIAVTNNQTISGGRLSGSFADIATTSLFGIQLPVYIMLAVVVVLWWWLEHTVTGRRIHATGFNEEAARLTGVHVGRLRMATLVLSAMLACAGGIIISSQLTAGAPEAGPSYLLDSYAAVFLGATQIHPGRFNAWGTLLAVLLLATGQTGLALIPAPQWASSCFTGTVLLLALIASRGAQKAGRKGESPDEIKEDEDPPVAQPHPA